MADLTIQGTPIGGAVPPIAPELVAVDDVKAELVMNTTNEFTSFMAVMGNQSQQEEAIQNAINWSVSRAERELKSDLRKKVIKCYPAANLVKGVDYDVDEDPYDFFHTDYQSFGYMVLRHRPVQSIQKVDLRYGPAFEILTYPMDWIRCNRKFGRLSVLPTASAFGAIGPIVLASGYFFLPMMLGWVRDIVPQMICVDYTSGVDATDPEFAELRHQVARLATAEIFRIIGRAYKPGIGSYSVGEDGASESVSLTRGAGVLFQSEIALIEQDWARFVARWFESQMPIQFQVI